jgi:hypothetical protein
MNALAAWIFAVVTALAPYRPANGGMRRYRPDATAEAHAARLGTLATDLAAVVLANPPLPGMGRASTLRLLLSIAYLESGFERDVDLGLGHGRGDSGRSFCLMQVQTGQGHVKSSDPEIASWTGPDLVADRTKCFRAGLSVLRGSLHACAHAGFQGADRLSAYTSGTCQANEPAAKARWSFAQSRTIGRPLSAEALSLLKATK